MREKKKPQKGDVTPPTSAPAFGGSTLTLSSEAARFARAFKVEVVKLNQFAQRNKSSSVLELSKVFEKIFWSLSNQQPVAFEFNEEATKKAVSDEYLADYSHNEQAKLDNFFCCVEKLSKQLNLDLLQQHEKVLLVAARQLCWDYERTHPKPGISYAQKKKWLEDLNRELSSLGRVERRLPGVEIKGKRVQAVS